MSQNISTIFNTSRFSMVCLISFD